MNRMNAEETLRRAEAPLFWVGAFTVASLALWLLYRLLSGFRIWVLGNGKLLSPKLGRWAGESGHITFFFFSFLTVTWGRVVGGWVLETRLQSSNFTLAQRPAVLKLPLRNERR